MAHELRTPLTTISVAGGSLENPQLDREKIGELTTIIRNQNKQLSKMIEHILDINLWEKDQIQLHKKRVDIESLLKNRIDAFAVEHKDDQMNMTSDIHCSPAEVYIDEFQIGIAIHNVLSNAVKYGGDPVAIDVKASVHDHRLIISIRDNGQGIPERQQKKIFEKFYRLPQNKTGKGLGLGLFYVKKIIDLHGGDVLVKSKLNEGTTFTLSIPVK
jgi:signal transduction histidine kinase